MTSMLLSVVVRRLVTVKLQVFTHQPSMVKRKQLDVRINGQGLIPGQ